MAPQEPKTPSSDPPPSTPIPRHPSSALHRAFPSIMHQRSVIANPSTARYFYIMYFEPNGLMHQTGSYCQRGRRRHLSALQGLPPQCFFLFFLRQERRDFLNVAHALALVKDLRFSSLSLIKLIQFATGRQEQGHASALSRVYSEP